MPHGSLPTCSSNFRCAQFLRMFPASKVGAARATARANAIMKQIISLGSSFQVTELGYQVFGLKHCTLKFPTSPKALPAADRDDEKPQRARRHGRVQGAWQR